VHAHYVSPNFLLYMLAYIVLTPFLLPGPRGLVKSCQPSSSQARPGQGPGLEQPEEGPNRPPTLTQTPPPPPPPPSQGVGERHAAQPNPTAAQPNPSTHCLHEELRLFNYPSVNFVLQDKMQFQQASATVADDPIKNITNEPVATSPISHATDWPLNSTCLFLSFL